MRSAAARRTLLQLVRARLPARLDERRPRGGGPTGALPAPGGELLAQLVVARGVLDAAQTIAEGG